MKKRRVLFISHVLPGRPSAGNEIRIRGMVEHLQESGFEVHFIYIPNRKIDVKKNKWDDAKSYIKNLYMIRSWTLKYDTFQILFHSIPQFREFAREILVNGFIALKERTLNMINLTAEQRYANLLNTRSDLFQNVSLKYLASYLGITDTSLSRIRKEFAQK